MKPTIAITLIGLFLVEVPSRGQFPPSSTPMPVSEVKADFLKMLDRPRVPLDVKTHEGGTLVRGVIRERFDFAVEAHLDGTMERVPALIARPEWAKAGDKLPAVIVLHGTGGNMEGNWGWIDQLAQRGILAVAIDGRYHGNRAGGQKGTKAYNEAIIQAWRS